MMSFGPWQFQVQHFLHPKEGSGAEECEDAVGVNEARGRFAVADGATEAFDAGRWAAQLAGAWVEAEAAPLAAPEFRAWAVAEGERLQDAWRGRALPWYAEEKARRGSFAAFVGLQFETNERQELLWRAVALGDCCLVQRRAKELCRAFPLSGPDEFHSAPPLVPSLWGPQGEVVKHIAAARGTAQGGDVFLLFSDALAAWYLRSHADGAHDALASFEAAVASWLASARRDNLVELLLAERRAARLRDDDYAVVRVTVERVRLS